MRIIKNIFRAIRQYFIPYIWGIISIAIIAIPCLGVETGDPESVFSVAIKNQTLKQALNNISKCTGYKITVSREWENRQLTADLDGVTLEEGLKKIIRVIGSPNYALITDEKGKSINIKIYDTAPGYSKVITTSNILLEEKQGDLPPAIEEVPPPELIVETKSIQEQVDPIDMEITPPEEIPPEDELEKGVTKPDLKAMETGQKDVGPPDFESIPPAE